jgi:error-prone DNA polymerase
LRPILDETLGVIIYQEQVVQVSMVAAGFSPGEAEAFRRALGRRNWEEHKPQYQTQFMAGTRERGIDEATATGLFGSLCGFAEFGFPKSHSVAFGLLAYQSAWLKEHYPAEFYCALFNNWPMGFYPPHVVTGDAKRHGVEVLTPDINLSQAKCTVESGQVRIGLGYVKAVGQKTALRLETERVKGEFASLFNLITRFDIPKLALENLIRAGAFGGFGLGGRALLWQLGLLADTNSAQTTLELPTEQDQVELVDFSQAEQVVTDYELIGLSTRAHPMQLMRSQLPSDIYPSGSLRQFKGRVVEVAGLTVCRQQPGTAKGTVFLTVEDECGLMNVVVPPKLYEARRAVVRSESFLSIKAVVEGHAGDVPLLRAVAINPLGASLRLDGDYARSWT